LARKNSRLRVILPHHLSPKTIGQRRRNVAYRHTFNSQANPGKDSTLFYRYPKGVPVLFLNEMARTTDNYSTEHHKGFDKFTK
jgi:hypothetical protein